MRTKICFCIIFDYVSQNNFVKIEFNLEKNCNIHANFQIIAFDVFFVNAKNSSISFADTKINGTFGTSGWSLILEHFFNLLKIGKNVLIWDFVGDFQRLWGAAFFDLILFDKCPMSSM